MKKVTQKSAFIVSYACQEFQKGKGMIKRHEFPLLVISNVEEMRKFLCRYTKYAEWQNNDPLAMRADLKNACWSVEISEMDLLQKEIMHDDTYGLHKYYREEYPEHLIHVHRVPLGIQKKTLMNVDFIP
ncbi:hypothetical protein RM549_06120 [Salegentibacter sp. F188]|uniref:Uncharacterized protein n=1 Tax=Autumnicola patrickiae TaxID=3075591 RepID=A0ABU3E0E0_9FLAO|nr:hypothetical protein [Salegentibacter sp. F188]MDT0689353.1 hypothetical protein [Salegentibacter sp. F188]